MKTDHASDVAGGRRFEFGKNWARFLRELDETRIVAAVDSLREMLEIENLNGRSFLDIGCGSGLFSLAARRLGATVASFDFDPASVECTEELKRRYCSRDPLWSITYGSALDAAFLNRLGQFDVVYSWGVLHHTGAMWQALENAALACKPGSLLFIAIYNDQGGTSLRWAAIKRLYNRSPRPVKFLLVLAVGVYFKLKHFIAIAARFENPFARRPQPTRGMAWFRDLVDWVGGYPFEVARPEQVFDFYRARGFSLMRLKTDRGHGCNEFVFRRDTSNH
jgi:2-polyprenyl-6-hydroxyphenyl methylase/3-demethylubiquinone-9 3-methyltransferase